MVTFNIFFYFIYKNRKLKLLMKETNMISNLYKSKIDNRFIVVISKHPGINKISDDAILDKKNNVIIINGFKSQNWNEEHFLCIEAHEISHNICNHKDYGNIKFEMEADKMAFLILKFLNKYKSAEIIKDRFYMLYRIKINKFRLKFRLKIKLIIFLVKKLFIWIV
jgi:hypothetical protein